MNNPMSWSIPLFRVYGILVRVHILFIVFSAGMLIRQLASENNPIRWYDAVLVYVVLQFVIVLLHEFGHCYAARSVGGDAKEVLMWPLGGLAYVEVPNTPRANWIATAGGPAVNVIICAACATGLAVGGYLPNLSPVAAITGAYKAETKSWRDGRVYTSEYGLKLYVPGTRNDPHPRQPQIDKELKKEGSVVTRETGDQIAAFYGGERAIGPGWAINLNRAFSISWFLFLFNLIPAFPLDGGRLLQASIWKRSDYRRGITVAAYSGYICAMLFLVASIGANESMVGLVAVFILFMSWQALVQLEAEDNQFGYDFSAGYTSLERDDPPPPKPKKLGWYTRWRQARRARKQAEAELADLRDRERMDQLLEKIARKEKLTDEERRFLERVSARLRNRS
jgi:Zn-dependent protease